MKTRVLNLLITAILFSSCSTPLVEQRSSVRSPADAPMCKEIITAFLSPTRFDAQAFNKKLKLDISTDHYANYLYAFREVDLNKMTDDQISSMRAIYLFSVESKEVRDDLVTQFVKTIKGETLDLKNKSWNRFIKHKEKVKKYSLKKLMPEEQSLIYEKLYYSCRAQTQKTPSSADLKKAKYLTYALSAGATTSAASTYTVVNWEEEKDSKWMKGLYFEIGMTAVFTYVGGKYVTSNPKLNPWTGRAPLSYFNAAIADAGTSSAYAYIFNSSDAEMEKKLETLKKDPRVQEELAELLYYAQENKLFEKHAKATEQLFKHKNTEAKMTSLEMQKAIDMDKLDLEESRELLFAAMAEKEYEEKSGKLKTGHKGTDRYAFHRMWGLASVPANISLALIMHKQMCMATNPKVGFAKAVSTFFAGSVLLDAIYYKTRREVINQ